MLCIYFRLFPAKVPFKKVRKKKEKRNYSEDTAHDVSYLYPTIPPLF